MMGEARPIIDAASIMMVVGVLTDVLPHVAALLTVVWLALRILEHIRWIRRGRPAGERP
jgi:hypothetical protein